MAPPVLNIIRGTPSLPADIIRGTPASRQMYSTDSTPPTFTQDCLLLLPTGWGKVIVSVCLFVHMGVPRPGPDGGTATRSGQGGTLNRDGVPPVQTWPGYPSHHPGIGYPCSEMGYLPVQRWSTPPPSHRWDTPEGGMPLAFTLEDFLVSWFVSNFTQCIVIKVRWATV